MDKVNFDGPLHSVSNWNTWVPPELKGRAPFRPMIHLERELNGNEWKFVLESKESIVHFFNEPERNGISVEKAVKYWKDQVVPALRRDRKKKLVSPSCASDPAGTDWLTRFMNHPDVKASPPDYLGLHYYGDKNADAKKYIEDMHNKWPSRPVIVSEIASISRDQSAVDTFTREMCNWFDGKDWVFEYAFFGCMTYLPDNFVSPAARLMREDGSFTPLMERYMNQQPMK
ncbi:hypothetical protein B0J11DRAFT_446829 [Dendryphion nanum]|uniref:Asl1-like glycosyl hydrolase catalytic domain-containing protein n=1 Tax=Dendryphion nanum TaxID=256645 RepID=A0A9P9D4I2_9PLEO|nr:hypothetical protein B0J11DRAFT_446829 [Dendryphion nanum]